MILSNESLAIWSTLSYDRMAGINIFQGEDASDGQLRRYNGPFAPLGPLGIHPKLETEGAVDVLSRLEQSHQHRPLEKFVAVIPSSSRLRNSHAAQVQKLIWCHATPGTSKKYSLNPVQLTTRDSPIGHILNPPAVSRRDSQQHRTEELDDVDVQRRFHPVPNTFQRQPTYFHGERRSVASVQTAPAISEQQNKFQFNSGSPRNLPAGQTHATFREQYGQRVESRLGFGGEFVFETLQSSFVS